MTSQRFMLPTHFQSILGSILCFSHFFRPWPFSTTACNYHLTVTWPLPFLNMLLPLPFHFVYQLSIKGNLLERFSWVSMLHYWWNFPWERTVSLLTTGWLSSAMRPDQQHDRAAKSVDHTVYQDAHFLASFIDESGVEFWNISKTCWDQHWDRQPVIVDRVVSSGKKNCVSR